VALVAVICVVGLSGALVASAAVDRAEQRHAAVLMTQYANQVEIALKGETDRYSDTLSDMSAAVGAQSAFTESDFRQITSTLNRQRLPGATGVLFVAAATDDQVAGLQATWRAQGAPGLMLAPSKMAGEHLFAIFNRALDGVPAVAGRDISQTRQPAEAMRLARATGKVTASHTYVLVKDLVKPAAQRQLSFVLADPIYGGLGTPDAGAFRGWMVMGMRGGDLIDATLNEQSEGAVTATLTDMSTSPPTVVTGLGGVSPAAGSLNRSKPLVVGQREWRLDLAPTRQLLVSGDRQLPAITFGIAALITLLVAAMAGILAGARNRAMEKVDNATAALRNDISRREATEIQLRERESELRHLALHDPLTGLANRILFYERVDHALDTHSRGAPTLAVLFIDLDGFKRINDNLGHGAGDAVLTEVAVRLADCVRTGDTVGRFGGDEFAVLAEQITTVDDVAIVADRIIHALQLPFDLDGRDYRITASVGVALRRPGDRTADAIIHNADVAMYAAKTAGKDHYVIAGAGTDEALAGPAPLR
jgi:diguanylate cyclase (GGDEF)-like protein